MRTRRRAQSYMNLDGTRASKDEVSWYWRVVAVGSSIMILGGYLMLPATFDNDPLLRVSKSVLGICAVALLTAGFSLTGLLSFAVREPRFQAEVIFLPSLISCALGLFTVFYDFLISSRFVWNTPALLLTVAASISTIIYGGLLVFTYRKVGAVKSNPPGNSMLLRPMSMSSASGTWQDTGYYQNYVANMYPTSAHQPQPVAHDPNLVTEEEMQRQRLLMLLLHKERSATPDPSQSTFHIDLPGRGRAPNEVPLNGYYAPSTAVPLSAYPQTAYPLQSGISEMSRQWTTEGRPWEGARGGPPARGRGLSIVNHEGRAQVDSSRERREERRREIEMGR